MRFSIIIIVLLIIPFKIKAESYPDIRLEKEQSVLSGGYVFRPIQNWHVNILERTSSITSTDKKACIIINLVEAGDLIIRSETPKIIKSRETLFDAIINSFTENAEEQIKDKKEIIISDSSGIISDFSSNGFGDINIETTGRIAMTLFKDSHVFIMIGFSFSPDKWKYNNEFDAILKSIRLFEPEK